jgi:nicotinamide mononucleotide transporter
VEHSAALRHQDPAEIRACAAPVHPVKRNCWRRPAGTAIGRAVNPLEMIAAVLGLANIVLLARRSIWNYPFALAMVVLSAFVFYEARLYSDVLLQIFFFTINIYGWINWLRSKGAVGEVAAITMSDSARVAWTLIGLIAIYGWGHLMERLHAALPWWDASIAIGSVIAQILLSRRYWENWVLWIVVDAVAMGVYWAKDLRIFVGLYAIFFAMSVWGLIAWRGSMAPRSGSIAL